MTLDERRTALIENVEWIIATDTPESVARRLGYKSPKTLARALHRYGRPDLAAGLVVIGDPYLPTARKVAA